MDDPWIIRRVWRPRPFHQFGMWSEKYYIRVFGFDGEYRYEPVLLEEATTFRNIETARRMGQHLPNHYGFVRLSRALMDEVTDV